MASNPFDALPANAAKNLQNRYTVTSSRILSSTSIANRTAAVLQALKNPNESQDAKNADDRATAEGGPAAPKLSLVALSAFSKNANKLISIVEIVKRERKTAGEPSFQYNALTQQLMDVPRESRKPKVLLDAAKVTQEDGEDGKDGDSEEDDEGEAAFETIPDPQDSLPATKKRSVPIMTVFVSTVSVKELKAAFGEQT